MSKSPESVRVAIAFADGSVGFMSFITCEYTGRDEVRWRRLATSEAVEAELARTCFAWALHPGKLTRQPTDAEVLAGMFAMPLPIVGWRFIGEEEIPERTEYRNALQDSGKVIAYDMVKARELHRDRLRVERAPLLAGLDVEQLRAIAAEDKAAIADVESRKQALRDITKDPAIDAAQTIDELKAAVADPVIADKMGAASASVVAQG